MYVLVSFVFLTSNASFLIIINLQEAYKFFYKNCPVIQLESVALDFVKNKSDAYVKILGNPAGLYKYKGCKSNVRGGWAT